MDRSPAMILRRPLGATADRVEGGRTVQFDPQGRLVAV